MVEIVDGFQTTFNLKILRNHMDLLYVSGRNDFPHGIEIQDVIFVYTLIKRGAQGGCEFVCLIGCQDELLGFC